MASKHTSDERTFSAEQTLHLWIGRVSFPPHPPKGSVSFFSYLTVLGWAFLRWAILRWAILRWAIFQWSFYQWALIRWASLPWAFLRHPLSVQKTGVWGQCHRPACLFTGHVRNTRLGECREANHRSTATGITTLADMNIEQRIIKQKART